MKNCFSMLKMMRIGLIFSFIWSIMMLSFAEAQESGNRSRGFLTFKAGGIVFKADSSHARAYGVKQSDKAFLSAANKENLILDVKWNGFRGAGTYVIYKSKGEAELMLNLKTYSLVDPDDYLKITITGVKEKGALLLLNGVFEGKVQDKKGNKIILTEGRFETYSL
jgi:hypothetical protein